MSHSTSIRVALTAIVLLAVSPIADAGEVPHLSGGVGLDERQAILSEEKNHNLKVVVADDTGDFLADVQVVIESAKKEPMLDATMKGPILLAKLPPGTYTVKATSDEKTLTKTVSVPAQGLRTVDFRWPRSKKETD